MLDDEQAGNLYVWMRDHGVDFGNGRMFPKSAQLAPAFSVFPTSSQICQTCLNVLKGEAKVRFRRVHSLNKYLSAGLPDTTHLKAFVTTVTRIAEVLDKPLISKHGPESVKKAPIEAREAAFLEEWNKDGGASINKWITSVRKHFQEAGKDYYRSRNIKGDIAQAVYDAFTETPRHEQMILAEWRRDRGIVDTPSSSPSATQQAEAEPYTVAQREIVGRSSPQPATRKRSSRRNLRETTQETRASQAQQNSWQKEARRAEVEQQRAQAAWEAAHPAEQAAASAQWAGQTETPPAREQVQKEGTWTAARRRTAAQQSGIYLGAQRMHPVDYFNSMALELAEMSTSSRGTYWFSGYEWGDVWSCEGWDAFFEKFPTTEFMRHSIVNMPLFHDALPLIVAGEWQTRFVLSDEFPDWAQPPV